MLDEITAEAGRVPLLAIQHPDGRYLKTIIHGQPVWTNQAHQALDLGPSRAVQIVEDLGPIDRGRSCRIVTQKCEMVIGWKIAPNGEDPGDEIECPNEAVGRVEGVPTCGSCGAKLYRYLAD